MSRVKIEMPDHFLFSTEIEIRINDINYANHLGNDSLLSLVQEARVRFLASLGYNELDIEGVGIIMNDVAIIFKAEAHFGDRLRFEIAVDEISRKSCDFFYKITVQDNRIVALCKTGIVFYNYQLKKPVSIPDAFLLKVNR